MRIDLLSFLRSRFLKFLSNYNVARVKKSGTIQGTLLLVIITRWYSHDYAKIVHCHLRGEGGNRVPLKVAKPSYSASRKFIHNVKL